MGNTDTSMEWIFEGQGLGDGGGFGMKLLDSVRIIAFISVGILQKYCF